MEETFVPLFCRMQKSKIFMSASSKARAQRRYDEYISKGIDADYETIYQDIVARDYQDTHREISPLAKNRRCD